MRIASCLDRRWCVIALVSGPERGVGMVGERDRALSREVANVRVV